MILGEIQEDLLILRCGLHIRIKTNTCPAPPPLNPTLHMHAAPSFHGCAATQHICGFVLASETCHKSQHAYAENIDAQYDPSAPNGKSLSLASPRQADPKAVSLNLILRLLHTRHDPRSNAHLRYR
jgi:hypothetical protein